MILTAHQPAYLPWLGYLHKILLSDVYVLLDEVQFERNSFINRNKIYSNNGELMLTIPIQMKGHIGKPLKEIKVNNIENWRKKHWTSILYSYKKAPFFDCYATWFESFYRKEWEFLIDITNEMLIFLFTDMGIKTEIVRQSDLGIKSQKQNLVLDICKSLNADIYLSGSLGKNYLDLQTFKNEDIKIYFQDYYHPVYPQFGRSSFIPYLGIIDLLMNVGSSKAIDTIVTGNIQKNYLKNY